MDENIEDTNINNEPSDETGEEQETGETEDPNLSMMMVMAS